MSALEEYVSLSDLAAEAGVTLRTVRRWAYQTPDGLPVTRLGRKPLVHRDDLRAWLAAHRLQRNPRNARNR